MIEKPRTAQFYLLPKIHKNLSKPLGRPIVSANDCPTEHLSEVADFFLKPLMTKLRSYLRDTSHFLLEIMKLGSVPANSVLVTFDVVSLYTNILICQAILCIIQALNLLPNTSQKPCNSTIKEMVKVTLESNNFQFNGDNYLQVGGTAMGTRVAPSLANIFMADFEEKYVYTYHKQPFFGKRYLDDCILVRVHGVDELKKFSDNLNGAL